MKVAVFETEDANKRFFTEQLSEFAVSFHHEALDDNAPDGMKDAEILVLRSASKCDQSILSQFPNLKMISTRSTGFDHIDRAYCTDNGIVICNVPGYGQYTVAEHTIALLLAISRQIYPSIERTKQGNFHSKGLMGFELYGKTLGVIGVGSIGRSVIRIAKALGMQVLAYTRTTDPEQEEELGFEFTSLDRIYAASDIISLHVPYTEKTHYLINSEAIQKMKKGVVLINTARGAVVDTKALITGVKDGTISACGLDVLEHEVEMTELEKELIALDNVIVTPHNAYHSKEALQRILQITVDNIKAFKENTPENVV